MSRCVVLIIHDGMQKLQFPLHNFCLWIRNITPESSYLELSQKAASLLCCSGSLGRAGVVLAEESVCCSGWCFCQVLSRANCDALHQQKISVCTIHWNHSSFICEGGKDTNFEQKS